MGLLIECPKCKKRNNPKNKVCRCGVNLAKVSGRTWWIEYYWDGSRKRERIGPNKEAAEKRLRDVLNARVEGRYIKKSPDARTLFKDLAAWYLDLAEIKAKRSYCPRSVPGLGAGPTRARPPHRGRSPGWPWPGR